MSFGDRSGTGGYGTRSERFALELHTALYARFHPLLCAHMPHRFFPVRKAAPICIRCGVSMARPVVVKRVRWWRA